MPSDVTPISLARALKVKNRVTNRLAQLDALIQTHNSAIEGNQEYDTRQLFKSRVVLAAALVRLKVNINTANQPVQNLIYELAECKALIASLKKINTKHGVVVESYSGARVTYAAQFRQADVDREVRRAEQEIDRLQEELDRFNQRTLIAVDKALLEDREEAEAPK
jgi:hypothetical protein